MKPHQLFLFVEGEGDRQAVPVLVKRLLKERGVQDRLVVASNPFVVGEFPALRGRANDFAPWKRFLELGLRKYSMESCLLLLDGDTPKQKGVPFCAMNAARDLARIAEDRGAGSSFSASIVFARQEFESWLIAGAASLAGKSLADGRGIFPLNLSAPEGDIEESPRNAKGFFESVLSNNYRPSLHQASITSLVDLNLIRQRKMRSFRRLENAIDEMISSLDTGRHIVSPIGPD